MSCSTALFFRLPTKTRAALFKSESGLTFKVFVEDVLQAVEDGFVIFDFSALGGICPLLTAFEVGVHFTRVRGVLFVMCYLQTQMTQIRVIKRHN